MSHDARPDQRGQSLVEFTLVMAFVLIPLLVAFTEGSFLFYKYVTLANGAREGARAGVVFREEAIVGSCDQVAAVDANRAATMKAAIDRTVEPLITICSTCWTVVYDHDHDGRFDDPADRTPEVRPGMCDIYRQGDVLRVTLNYTHRPIINLVIGLSSINLSARATMVIEPGGAKPTPTPG